MTTPNINLCHRPRAFERAGQLVNKPVSMLDYGFNTVQVRWDLTEPWWQTRDRIREFPPEINVLLALVDISPLKNPDLDLSTNEASDHNRFNFWKRFRYTLMALSTSCRNLIGVRWNHEYRPAIWPEYDFSAYLQERSYSTWMQWINRGDDFLAMAANPDSPLRRNVVSWLENQDQDHTLQCFYGYWSDYHCERQARIIRKMQQVVSEVGQMMDSHFFLMVYPPNVSKLSPRQLPKFEYTLDPVDILLGQTTEEMRHIIFELSSWDYYDQAWLESTLGNVPTTTNDIGPEWMWSMQYTSDGLDLEDVRKAVELRTTGQHGHKNARGFSFWANELELNSKTDAERFLSYVENFK